MSAITEKANEAADEISVMNIIADDMVRGVRIVTAEFDNGRFETFSDGATNWDKFRMFSRNMKTALERHKRLIDVIEYEYHSDRASFERALNNLRDEFNKVLPDFIRILVAIWLVVVTVAMCVVALS